MLGSAVAVILGLLVVAGCGPAPSTAPLAALSVPVAVQPAVPVLQVAFQDAPPAGRSGDAGAAKPVTGKAPATKAKANAAVDVGKPANPFDRRIKAPEFPKDMQWLNSKPLTKTDLKGKFVLLDFWTYCCINCMHILPELKKLEQEFPNKLVVIGVHSAKFDTEKDAENIREAILRYEIEHPVVNDADHEIWDTLRRQQLADRSC